jgi:hypothetical protein
MRALLLGAMLALVLETVLALAFWAGAAWLGGLLPWPWNGIAMAVAAAAAMAAVLAGDLDAAYDSERHRLDVRLGWLARRQSSDREDGPGRLTRTRILFVSWTARTDRPADDGTRVTTTPAVATRRSLFARLAAAAEPLSRALAGAAPALHELTWHAREMRIRVESPTRVTIADRALAALIGQRRFGPLEIQFGEGGERAIRARYRVRLYRAVLVALAMFAEGRPDRAVRALGAPPHSSRRDIAQSARRE